jgi:hypothetical protein
MVAFCALRDLDVPALHVPLLAEKRLACVAACARHPSMAAGHASWP